MPAVDAALQLGEVPFRTVRGYVAPDVLAFGVIDARMLADEPPVDDRAIGIEAAIPVKMLPQRRAHRVVVKKYRPEMATALPSSALAGPLVVARLSGDGFSASG